MLKPWIIGFIEAEGSFYLVKKSNIPLRFTQGFGITQKLDKLVLENMATIMKIEAKVRYKDKHNYYILDTTKTSDIQNIINYMNDQMIGMKSVE